LTNTKNRGAIKSASRKLQDNERAAQRAAFFHVFFGTGKKVQPVLTGERLEKHWRKTGERTLEAFGTKIALCYFKRCGACGLK
jgi:hypothetical protein